ncbi:MAG TPA: hypothetical protein VFZ21_27225 [Gemmatimonadaceae bacterium]|nr:hypothetical protein [Gemmatimonadaceae bacterium]
MVAVAQAMTGRPVLTADRGEREPYTPEVTPTLARDVERVIAVAAVALNIMLSVIDVWRPAFVPAPPGALQAGVMAAVVAVPLHIRHVLYGLRGERPPAGIWTLALLVLVNTIAIRFVGPVWLMQLASLVVSILIVVPGMWGLPLAAAVTLSPFGLVGLQWYSADLGNAGTYLVFAILWRATTQYVPLRLTAAIRALDMAGRELEARAVVEARVRIDTELRTSVASALEQIVARGDAARVIAEHEPGNAAAELRQLVADSRRALAQARRLVAQFRGSSWRVELDALADALRKGGDTA